jgi:hypothetical protein
MGNSTGSMHGDPQLAHDDGLELDTVRRYWWVVAVLVHSSTSA